MNLNWCPDLPDDPVVKEISRWDPYPKPPIKPRTAYAFFVADHYRRYCRRLKTRNLSRIIRAVVNHWKQLTEIDAETKTFYIQKAIDDKKRYYEEKAIWKANFTVGRAPRCHRIKKNPSAPKRPNNMFMQFQLQNLPRIAPEFPGYNRRELLRLLGKYWKQMDDAEKLPYKNRYNEEMVRYRNEIRAFRVTRARKKIDDALRKQTIRLEALKLRQNRTKLGVQVDEYPVVEQKIC